MVDAMATAERLKMTPAEFLDFERGQTEKHLFWDGEVFARTSGTRAHSRLSLAVTVELERQLKRPCETHTSDMRVHLPEGRYVYPDGSVACLPEFGEGPEDTLLNPVVVIEVLSDGTEAFDRGKKFHGYSRIPSLRHYVLLSQHEPLIEVFSREDASANWSLRSARPGQELQLSPPGVTLNVDAIYRDVELTPEPPPPEDPKRS